MRTIARTFLAVSFTWIQPLPAVSATSTHSLPGYAYVSPAPGSALHLPGTNIIVRPGGVVDPTTLVDGVTIQVTGSISGPRAGRLRLSDDERTILFLPHDVYAPDESVTCVIAPGIRTNTGGELPGAEFTFRIAHAAGPAPATSRGAFDEDFEFERARAPLPAVPLDRGFALRAPGAASDTLPSDFPAIQATVSGTPAPGHLFLSDVSFADGFHKSYLMILNNDGTPVWYRKLDAAGFDFKMQPNRWLTWFDAMPRVFYAMNARYALVDSFRCGNGYETDVHELVLLANGHALLMAYDSHIVDMSAVVSGGYPAAVVTGLIIQELDREKDVVFQWRSWDHFQITDVTSRSLTAVSIDYAHGNAIQVDSDGDLLISSRHMDEITKISRETGEILWRLGGKNNQFTFVNDPDRFSQQHAIRRLPNGHVTLFDNGNYHTPPRSRAVEYALDEVNRTATLVWEYRNTPDTYGFAMGYTQRLPNGNTLIGWGAANPTATEVSPDGQKVAEINLPQEIYSYRAFKHEWPPVLTAQVRLDSGVFDVTSADPWVTFSIEPDGFEADSIDIGSVRLGGIDPGHVVAQTGLFDSDGDGRLERSFRMARDVIAPYLTSKHQQLELTGSLTSGEQFRGVVDVGVGGSRRIAARMVSPVGALPVRIDFRTDGVTPRVVPLVAYDIRGRLVNRWQASTDAAGIVEWNGRGFSGRRVSSGVYFVGTEGIALTEMARVVLLR